MFSASAGGIRFVANFVRRQPKRSGPVTSFRLFDCLLGLPNAPPIIGRIILDQPMVKPQSRDDASVRHPLPVDYDERATRL